MTTYAWPNFKISCMLLLVVVVVVVVVVCGTLAREPASRTEVRVACWWAAHKEGAKNAQLLNQCYEDEHRFMLHMLSDQLYNTCSWS